MVSLLDIYWAAGFMDGEGSFIKAAHSIGTTASQKDPWPLVKLQGILGGRIFQDGAGYWRWHAYGAKAVGIMMTLYPILSPRRQRRICELLSFWRFIGLRGSHNRNKTHCKRGHLFTPESTYPRSSGRYRECKTCRDAFGRASRTELLN